MSDPRHDGISRAHRTGDYRCRFKDALIATGLTGFGRMLNATGEQPNLPMDADTIEVSPRFKSNGSLPSSNVP